jgi:hypothetical protein
MSRIAIRLWTLATYVLALVAVPAVTPAKATTSNGGHLNKPKKQKRPGFSDPWFAGQARPGNRPSSQAGGACPGNGRSFECSTWPPLIYDDPDRKVPGSDGG